jgi:pimeloyl-ACP methyl ester carboxylesterase
MQMVLCGRQDSECSCHHEEMTTRLPNSLVVIECGHMSTMERPDRRTAALDRGLLLCDFEIAFAVS